MRILMITLLAALLGGCYDPNLGATPFRCAADDGKKCPDGYTCQKNICVKDQESTTDGAAPVTEARILTDAQLLPSKEGLVYIDGAPKLNYGGCDDKDNEPNNSAKDATPITGQGKIPGWEICPAGDIDQFSIELTKGQKLMVTVVFKNDLGDLDAAIFDPDGYLVAAARGKINNETMKLPPAQMAGKYILGVYGFGPVQNSYDLEISIQ
jgi:hypothetical protein